MKSFDWIAIGGGLAGATLSYELAKKGFAVLLLEQDAGFQNATYCSYGGLAFWSGTTDLSRKLCQEGIERYHNLSQELEADIQLRELDLLLTIAPEDNPEKIAASYAHCAIAPRLLSVKAACELEPLLNAEAIAGALTVPHGHISPGETARAYRQGLIRRGGQLEIAKVTNLLWEGNRVVGVQAGTESYRAANVAVCAGGLSRSLLKAAGISVPVYFTHAEMVEIPALTPENGGVQLRTMVIPTVLHRFVLEAEGSRVEVERLWEESDREIVSPILDAGAIQFKDGRLRMGQISRILTNPDARIDRRESEAAIRSAVGKILPALENLLGVWHHCLVAFSSDRLALIGAIPNLEGIHIFSALKNSLVVIPPLAKRFADFVAGEENDIMSQLSLERFAK